MSEQHMDGTVAVDASCGKAGFLVLLRHGQTFWSESGQHTGRTNIPLTELAGFAQHGILDGIAEWDYGRAEGRTRQQVSEASGFSWDVWRDGPRSLTPTLEGDWVDTLPDGEQVNVHSGAGETLDEVAARARTAIEEVTPLLQSGRNVLLVAHAHILRILTSQWLNVDPQFARLLRLDTAHYSVLSVYKGDNVIERWNA